MVTATAADLTLAQETIIINADFVKSKKNSAEVEFSAQRL